MCNIFYSSVYEASCWPHVTVFIVMCAQVTAFGRWLMTPGGLGPLRARSPTSLSTLTACFSATMSGMNAVWIYSICDCKWFRAWHTLPLTWWIWCIFVVRSVETARGRNKERKQCMWDRNIANEIDLKNKKQKQEPSKLCCWWRGKGSRVLPFFRFQGNDDRRTCILCKWCNLKKQNMRDYMP